MIGCFVLNHWMDANCMHLLIRWKRPYPVSQLCASVAARVQGTKQPICVYIYVWNGRLENSVVYLADYQIVKLVMAYVQHGHGHDHEDDGVVLQAKSPPAVVALVLSALLVCPLLVLLVVRRRRFGTKEVLLSKLPSPPSRLPIIGHLHLVGPLPHVSLRDLSSKHGRDGLMLLHLGAVPTLIVSSPSAAQAVLRTQDHVFASRAYSPVTDILFYGSTDIAFSPYGEHWRQVKKIATTHLLTNRKVRCYRHARENEVINYSRARPY